MRRSISAIFALLMLPLAALAQDDLYFVPSKAQLKAEKQEKETRQQEKEARQLEREANTPTYYRGIDKTDDEYNRRKKPASGIHSSADGTTYSSDSIASDIIEFSVGDGTYSQNLVKTDTIYKYIFVNDEDDYQYSRYLSRWDDYWWWHRGYGPWGYGYPISWYAGWYDPYWDPWYGSWYGPRWYYSWYDPWYGPWYDPYWGYYGHYGYYDPFYHYTYWSGPYYPTGGGGGHHSNYLANRTGGAPTGTANHAGSSRNRTHHIGGNSAGSHNNAIARRNGDGPGATSHRYLRFGGSYASRNSYSSRSEATSGYSSSYSSGGGQSSRSSSTRFGGSYNGGSSGSSSSSGRSGGGGYSGGSSSSSSSRSSGGGSFGGSSGGGGSFGGGGTRSSGSSGGGGGGHFGGGRR